MRRYPSYGSSIAFGPGPLSPSLKAIIGANVAVFLLQWVAPELTFTLGLMPAAVLREFHVWQLATYMFLHAGLFHLLFNMLALWMFGTELERVLGTREFLKYYFVTGIGAGVLTVLFSLLPIGIAQTLWGSTVIGASGAIYGLLLAYGMYFPNRMLILFIFPVPARIAVLILGAIAFVSSIGGGGGGGVAHYAHLGGLVIGYLYLKTLRSKPIDEIKYRYLRC